MRASTRPGAPRTAASVGRRSGAQNTCTRKRRAVLICMWCSAVYVFKTLQKPRSHEPPGERPPPRAARGETSERRKTLGSRNLRNARRPSNPDPREPACRKACRAPWACPWASGPAPGWRPPPAPADGVRASAAPARRRVRRVRRVEPGSDQRVSSVHACSESKTDPTSDLRIEMEGT